MIRIYPFQTTARWLSLGFLAAALLLGSWATASAQDVPLTKPKNPNVEGKERKAPLRDFDEIKVLDKDLEGNPLPKPIEALSPHHEMLYKLAGHWSVQVRMHDAAGGEPTDVRGAARNTMILDGRALQSEFKGDFMGQPFVGLGLDGYDMDKEQHFSIWMDSTNTGVTHDSGECNHDGQDVVTYRGEGKDPATGKTLKTRSILTLRSSSRYLYEQWQTPEGGEEVLAMQVIYSKNK